MKLELHDGWLVWAIAGWEGMEGGFKNAEVVWMGCGVVKMFRFLLLGFVSRDSHKVGGWVGWVDTWGIHMYIYIFPPFETSHRKKQKRIV